MNENMEKAGQVAKDVAGEAQKAGAGALAWAKLHPAVVTHVLAVAVGVLLGWFLFNG